MAEDEEKDVTTEITPISWEELVPEPTATPTKPEPVTEPVTEPVEVIEPEVVAEDQEIGEPITWEEALTSDIEPSRAKLVSPTTPQRPSYLDDPPLPPDEVYPIGTLNPRNLWHGTQAAHEAGELGYVPEAALSLISQAVDFFPGQIRGLQETSASIWTALLGPEKTQQLEEMRHKLPVLGKLNDWIDTALDESGKLRQDSRELLIQEAREQGGLVGAGVAMLVDSVEQTLMMLGTFRKLKIGYGSQPGVGTTLKAAGVRAAIMAVTREGLTPKDRLGAFALSLAYQSTPAFSGTIGRMTKSDIVAKFVDVGSNFGISATQIGTMQESAKNEAEARGNPDDANFYFFLNAVQSFGADVVFGVMTKAFKTPAISKAESREIINAVSKDFEVESIPGRIEDIKITREQAESLAKEGDADPDALDMMNRVADAAGITPKDPRADESSARNLTTETETAMPDRPATDAPAYESPSDVARPVIDSSGAPELAQKPITTMPPEDRDALMSAVSESSMQRPGANISVNKVLADNPRYRYPLPTDPESRRQAKLDFEALVEDAINGRDLATDTSRYRWGYVTRYASGLASRYLGIADVASQTGDAALASTDSTRMELKRGADFVANNRVNDVYKRANISTDIDDYVRSNPDLDNALKAFLGISPEIKDTTMKKVRSQAVKTISSDSRGDELLRAMESWQQELTGPTAVNVRRIQVRRYRETWDEVGDRYSELKRIPAGTATDKENAEFEKLTKTLTKKLPWRYNPDTKQGEPIKISEVNEAMKVLNTSSEREFISYLSKVSWGTRKHYYMTMHDLDIDAKITSQPELIPDMSEKQVAEKIGVTSRINKRVGYPELKQGSIFSDLRRHVINLQIQSDTYDSTMNVANKLNKYAAEGFVPRKIATGYIDGMRMDWGYHKDIHPFSKVPYALIRPFWTSFALIPNRVGWYSARNVGLQGVPWGAALTQYRADDITLSLPKVAGAMRDSNSNLTKFIRDRFAWNISHANSMFFEGHMQLAPSERVVPINRQWAAAQSKLYQLSATTLGVSDNWNRLFTSMVGYEIADKHVGRFVRGEINQAQLEHDLLIDAFPSMIKNNLLTAFNEAKFSNVGPDGVPILNRPSFERFIRDVAETKTLMLNYPYRISERSALEQDPNARWMAGVVVFARGTFELVYRTTVKPLVQTHAKWIKSGFDPDKLDVNTVKSAWRNVAANAISHAISGFLMAKSIGLREKWSKKRKKGQRLQEPFRFAEQIGGWEPWGIGGKMAEKLYGHGRDLIVALTEGDLEEAGQATTGLMDQALFFTIVLPSLSTVFEAIGDRKAMKNTDVLISILSGKIKGGKPVAHRNWYAALMHVLFDTEPAKGQTGVERQYKKIKKMLE